MRPPRPAARLLFGLLLPPAALAAADGPRIPSIMAVMHKQNTVSRAPFKVVKKEMEARSPDWEAVREAGAKFGGLAAALAKNEPPEGSPESWRRSVDRHLADAKALEVAAASRDPAALRAAHQRIAESCTACHRAHRSRPGD